MTAQRAQAQARAARAHRSAELARMRRSNRSHRGDARARTATALRDLAGRIDTRDAARRPVEAGC